MPDHDAVFDVLIVGFGPSGAVLANLLGQAGLSILVIDKEVDIYPLPRAVHFDDEIMRVLQTIGVADAMRDKVIVNKGMRFVDPSGKILLDWPRPQEIGPQGWYPSYRFHQPDLERVLRAALDAWSNVSVRTGWAMTSIEQHTDHVVGHLEKVNSQEKKSVSAKFVVGCDGARSSVRSQMGAEMQELGFAQRWLVADFLTRRPLPHLSEFTLQICDANRPTTYCRAAGDRRRWEFALREDEADSEALDGAFVWSLLEGTLSKEDADLERQAVYTFRSEVSDFWCKERVLIAGDAAHLTPPFMGQGMCAGIRDVSNLAWKLERCCHGSAPLALLDSYQSERKPNVKRYISTASDMGNFINQMSVAADVSGDVTLGEENAKMKSHRSELGPGLGREEDLLRGTVFPQPRLSDDRLLDEHVGHRPVLIFSDDFQERPALDDLILLDARSRASLLTILRELDCTSVLVRPDRYIFASHLASDPETAQNGAQALATRWVNETTGTP